MSYFEQYSSRELYILEKWIYSIPNLRSLVLGFSRHNTGFHDALVKFKNNWKILVVEIKEEEFFWFSKTGNIGLDYISAFKFIEPTDKENILSNNSFWIKKENLLDFKNKIQIMKGGKLMTCDSHIQIFYVEDSQGEIVFIKSYDNIKLKKNIHYFETNFNLRINNKTIYDSKADGWESCAYFVNPKYDSFLKSIEIKTTDDLNKLLSKE